MSKSRGHEEHGIRKITGNALCHAERVEILHRRPVQIRNGIASGKRGDGGRIEERFVITNGLNQYPGIRNVVLPVTVKRISPSKIRP